MASDCKTVIDGIETQVQQDINTFRNDVISAVAGLIGYPSKSSIKNAQLRLDNALTNSEKKKATKILRTEEAKYADHNTLFDTIASDIFTSSQELNFDTNPIDAVDAWRVYFSKRYNLNVDPITILQSPRLIKSALKRVNEINT